MKPDTVTAMRQLIGQVRATIPFGLSDEQICASGCQGCSLNLESAVDRSILKATRCYEERWLRVVISPVG